MRRSLTALIFSVWSSIACANVPCTLPFTLQNGNTADATQVMANYNALVACLGQAAAAGINTDITQLIGLTTPLAPSEGGTPLFVGGTSTGSANAQVVSVLVPNNFSLTKGYFAAFVAGLANTGAMTLALNGQTATNVVVQTSNGFSSLSGAEVQVGQAKLVFYDGTQFQLVGAVPPTSLVPPCSELDYQGTTIPNGYLAENGQAVSRAGFPNLFACMSLVVSATLNSTTTIAVPNSALFQVGWFVGGNNVTCNSTIQSIPDGGHIVINNAAGATGASTLNIGPQAQGDCSTTFNVPGMNGRLSAGIDTAGGTLSSTACPNPASIGTRCGSQTQQIAVTNLPTITSTGSAVPTAPGGVAQSNGTISTENNYATGGGIVGPQSPGATWNGTTSIPTTVTSQSTNDTAFLLQPVGLVLKAIKF